MNREKVTNILIAAGVSAPLLTLMACISIGVGVVSDNSVLEVIGVALVTVSAISIVAGMTAAFISRKFLIGMGGLAGIALCIGMGFFTAIAIGAGQHHPPRLHEADADTVSADLSRYTEILGNQLEKDSWWTNGHTFFRVAQTGKTYLLEGMTLHEGGIEAQLESLGDSDCLWVATPRNGMTGFAETGCKVQRVRYRQPETDSVFMELLIACDKNDPNSPIDALQRYDGDELRYEFSGIHALLEGTYTDGTTEWALFPDGTVRLSADSEAGSYTIECFYHMPTNVVKLPDGRHVALQLTADDELLVLAAAYDADEEQWDEASPRRELMRLPRREQTPRRDFMLLSEERLVTPAMLLFMDGDIDDVISRYSSLDYSGNPVGHLNKALLRRWQFTAINETDE